MKEKYRVCKRCLMDTSEPNITFDENGICNHCKKAERQLKKIIEGRNAFDLNKYFSQIRIDGRKKKYDCVVGLSGGVDSCYVIYFLKKHNVRPLAVHVDNGWNTELAVRNIKNLLETLDVDLYTYVLNWNEFRDIQLAMLKASTPDSEVPTDQFILPALALVADHYNVKHVITGGNTATESIVPKAWSNGQSDWKYIREIHKKFGQVPIKTYLYYTRMMKYYFDIKLRWLNILDYIDYNKNQAKAILIEECKWRDYGGKHYESFYTRFYQSYILTKKFGFDKRRMHLSNLIIAGQITRDEAIKELQEPLFEENSIRRDIEYFCEKMEITLDDFNEIMETPPMTFDDYPSYENDLIGRLIRKVAKFNE